MVRDSRIKEVRFSKTINATTTGSSVSDHSINGEILEVNWAFNRAGSIFLTDSETGEEWFRRNTASGTGTQVSRPTRYLHDSVGALASAGSPVWYPVANGPVVLNYAGAASGTQVLSVNVRYR